MHKPGGDPPVAQPPTGPQPGREQQPGSQPDAPVSPAVDPQQPVPAADRTPPRLSVKVARKRGRRVLIVTANEFATLRGAGAPRSLAANTRVRIVVRRRGALRLVARDAAGNQTVKRVR